MRLIDRMAAVAASVTLAVTFFAAGLAVCAVPNEPTRLLAEVFAGVDNPETPFSSEELVKMAVVGKEYTFNTHDEQALYETMAWINKQAQMDGRTGTAAGAPDLSGIEFVDGVAAGVTAADLADIMALADEAYVLTPDAVSHLDDVYFVVQAVRWPLLLIAAFAVAAVAHVGVRCGRKPLGGVLIAAGAGLLAALAFVGVWAAFDFNGFFAVFHSLFFAAGTWTFSWDSLLITMYPLPFWMALAALWLGVAAALSITAVAAGVRLRRSNRPR